MLQNISLAILSKKFVVGSVVGLGVVALAVDPTVFAAAAVMVIGAIGGAAVLIINAIGKMKIDILDKQVSVEKKVEIVQGHVDGMTTRNADERAADKSTILALQQQVAEGEKRAALIAQQALTVATVAASQTPVILAPAAAPSTPSATQSLDNIDTNTHQIEKNTAKTDANVQALKDKE